MERKLILTISILCWFSLSMICAEESPPPSTIASTTTNTPPSTVTSTTTTTMSTTTETPEAACARKTNGTCEECVKGNSKCYYCETTKVCTYFNTLIPGYEKCGSLGDVKWATCKINFKYLIIGVSTASGILLLGLIICCCCCCKKRSKYVWGRDQVKWERQREELKMKSDERRKERQSRTDEIRRKYGLMKTDNNYQRFDA